MNQSHAIQRILAPIDASSQRASILNAAALVARAMDATVHVIHIDPDAPGMDTDTDAEAPGAASALVTAAVHQLRSEGVIADGAVMHGPDSDVDDLVLLEARRIAADLIVLGANHRRGLSALLESSVSEDVARRANAWVLLVP